ncbi:MAG: o-succinylbenzoate synthase [Planctomycetaceae bacterium]|nr:o-succinylbenzoate synthase [Planctomycetaceae bacterium]
MIFDRLDIHHVAMPLIQPWRTSYGEDADIHAVLVKFTSGNHVAWSESSPLFAPTYLTESAGGAFYHIAHIIGPHVVGKNYDTADDLNQQLALFKGNPFTKAAVEIGFWTLQSKITHTSLHQLLGGETREVQAGADFGIEDSIDILLARIQSAVDAGFPRVKLKATHGWDVDMLHAVRAAFPDLVVHIDCNSGYTLDHLPTFKKIDAFNLAFIEQPLRYDDLLDHAQLAKQIDTPICLDESITSVRAVEQALQIGAAQYINIKPGRVGGLANAVAIHDRCRDAGVPVWIGGMLESALGAAICVELATLPNVTYPSDLFPSSRFYHHDLSQPENHLTDRNTFRPFTEGLPQPDPARLKACTVESATVTP